MGLLIIRIRVCGLYSGEPYCWKRGMSPLCLCSVRILITKVALRPQKVYGMTVVLAVLIVFGNLLAYCSGPGKP